MIIQRDVQTFGPTPATGVTVSGSLGSVLTAYAQLASTQPIVGGQFNGSAPVDVGLDLLRFDTKTFFLKNSGPNPINAARLEATNVPAERRAADDWELIDSTTFQFLAAGSAKSKVITQDCRRYWRLQASSTNGTVAGAWVTAQ